MKSCKNGTHAYIRKSQITNYKNKIKVVKKVKYLTRYKNRRKK